MQDAFEAEYFSFKPVKSRAVVQIILEVDETKFHQMYETLGFPGYGKRVAVALLRDEKTD
jgi:hypothetical protein